MMELWIDGERCDIEKTPTIPIDFDVQSLSKVESARNGRTIEIELPLTECNRAIFRYSQDIYALSRFNAEHHTAVLKKEGVTIFEGTAYLIDTSFGKDGGGSYTLRIREGGADWVERVTLGKLSELQVPFSARLNLSAISSSWAGDSAVRFLPVWRSDKTMGYSSETPVAVERVMLTDDYHPFISVAKMVQAMFENTGYTLHSNFLASDFGQSLYMSGDYERSDASRAKSRCDFLARRSAPATATADATGRVYATTAFATHSIGPIVDTANPEVVDCNGEPMSDTFNTLNAFSMNSAGNICFTPRSSVKAGFILHLEYTTEYEVLSRDSFRGFDVVEGLNGVRVVFPLANTYKDYRKEFETNMQYRALVFDHIEGRSYRLMGYMPNGAIRTLKEWSSRSELVAIPETLPSSLTLYYRNTDSSTWNIYERDWALYAGYLDERGFVDVEMDLRLPPQDVASDEAYELDKFWFGGAATGMQLTVGTGTSLRPYFTTVPGYNSQLEFKDIAPRNVTQAELLTAIGEMFNLVFYTDRERGEVHIEPMEDFYKGAEVIDLTSRIDYREGVQLSDMGIGSAQIHTFAYVDADRATHLFNLDNDTTIGRWSHLNPLYGTTDSERKLGGTLFTPTVNNNQILAHAPSASLMKVGDMGEEENEGVDASFTPHIVCYKGMRQLPDGECWIASRRLNSYPYAAFFDDEEINLCFENRNGIEGLNAYYRSHLQRLCEAQTLTLDISLTTAEATSLLTANGPKPSLRKLFRFNIRGESSLYRLATIEGWREAEGVVRCKFLRLLKD